MPPDKPLVTAMHDGHRQRVAAADRAAQSAGVRPRLPLAQAQAMVPGLTIRAADPDGDAQALNALAGWCLRYAPLTAPDRPDGIWIDATGASHLFGGETGMLADIVERLGRSGIAARAAIAATPGTAWAVARYSAMPAAIVATDETAAILRPLPIAGLRLPNDMLEGLARVGFERIGQLMTTPRAPLALRFGRMPFRRLDQAIGRIFEPIEPISPPEIVSSRWAFPEPLLTPEAFAVVILRLVETVCAELERRGLGARRLDLSFERVDRTRQTICIGTARPSRQSKHLARLLDEQIEHVDPGLGIEAMHLAVPLVEPWKFASQDADLVEGETASADVSVLVDRLVNRIGAGRVYRTTPAESDVPERSVRRIGPFGVKSGSGWPRCLPRPIRLLKPPQPVDAMAVLPDQPPAQFIWRRRKHRIRRADGPERIAGEWWSSNRERTATRDYWQVEDDEGRRFWLYRNGDALDPDTGDLRWFLHGFF